LRGEVLTVRFCATWPTASALLIVVARPLPVNETRHIAAPKLIGTIILFTFKQCKIGPLIQIAV
jgi:hypothetical protein